ncbi:uncharacterized protein LOC133194964 [Saccostrea echinata]|uniref:uncharacterized protein LOC133194964 n=1 Tax=Saccostrea echinata TaxID=191078 RepID=UPI002A7EAF1D|nr:uncharacterized protein LOC133194964 [Saccostrea echinata]
MDSRTTAQDVMRCNICETSIVQMHCDTCFVNLCKVCVGEHFSNDLYKAHRIVDIKDRNSTLIFPQCATHSKNICESFCEDCNIPLCIKCVISNDTHKEHNLSIMSDMFDYKKQVIQKDFKELQELIVPTYQDIASDLQFRISQLESIYEYTTTVITKHGEEWHREIEKCVNNLKASVNKMKTSHIKALKEQQDDILKKVETIHEAVQLCENLADANDVSLTLSYTSLNEQFKRLPRKLVGSFPVFTPLQVQDAICKFRDLFGNLTNLSFIYEKYGYSIKGAPKSQEIGSSQVKQHLYEPKRVCFSSRETRQLWNEATSSVFTSINSGEEILETRNNDIKLFNSNQTSLVKSLTDGLPRNSLTDIAVTGCGDLAYISYDDGTLKILQNNKTENVVRLENWRPHSICCTSSDDLLVIMDSDDRKQTKLVRYSGCTAKNTIQYNGEYNPLYSSGKCKYISENRNLDICVADCGAGAVVVVNQAGKLRFRYTGHIPAPKNKPYRPKGITSDSQSYILTSDYNNDCIHITDQDGQCLRYIIDNIYIIHCQISCHPGGLRTDTNDNLYVCVPYNYSSSCPGYKEIYRYKYLA